jgi:hypothetical protein
MIDLKTYGDLKKLINSISTKQKGEKIISKGKEFALDQVLGFIPGASNAKTVFDFIRTAISKPDIKKTNTWLDKLDIDDEMSQIVDDTVENGFMQVMAKTIENESDSKPLEDDFNMNAKMVNYLKSTYSGRTISGIKENTMNKLKLKQLVTNILKEENVSSNVINISKDLEDRTGDFKQIRSIDKITQLFDVIVMDLGPDVVKSSNFKTALRNFYNKYK